VVVPGIRIHHKDLEAPVGEQQVLKQEEQARKHLMTVSAGSNKPSKRSREAFLGLEVLRHAHKDAAKAVFDDYEESNGQKANFHPV